MESTSDLQGEHELSIESVQNITENGRVKLASYRQVCVIGLCEKGDVRFCRYMVN